MVEIQAPLNHQRMPPHSFWCCQTKIKKAILKILLQRTLFFFFYDGLQVIAHSVIQAHPTPGHQLFKSLCQLDDPLLRHPVGVLKLLYSGNLLRWAEVAMVGVAVWYLCWCLDPSDLLESSKRLCTVHIYHSWTALLVVVTLSNPWIHPPFQWGLCHSVWFLS